MRACLTGAALMVLLAAPASADTLEVLSQNTLVLTALHGDGAGEAKAFLFKPDGRLEQTKPGGGWAAGFWRIEDGRTCITARGEGKLCILLEADRAVGDIWAISGPEGTIDYTAEIRAGRIRIDGEPAPG